MLIIAGLGNPGSKHASNRHNIGFMAADQIVRHHSFSPWKNKFNAQISEGTVEGEKVLVVKPQTFVNLSGEAIGKAMRFYKLDPSDVVVIYDELDLPAGKTRMKTGGGSGGHNGIRSIEAHCGKEFRRMRLGIGHPGDKAKVHGHVLGDFAKSDQDWVNTLLSAIADNLHYLVAKDEAGLMNKISLATSGDKSGNHAAKKMNKTNKSHIRQARNTALKEPPKSGPMADMLKKLFGGKDK